MTSKCIQCGSPNLIFDAPYWVHGKEHDAESIGLCEDCEDDSTVMKLKEVEE